MRSAVGGLETVALSQLGIEKVNIEKIYSVYIWRIERESCPVLSDGGGRRREGVFYVQRSSAEGGRSCLLHVHVPVGALGGGSAAHLRCIACTRPPPELLLRESCSISLWLRRVCLFWVLRSIKWGDYAGVNNTVDIIMACIIILCASCVAAKMVSAASSSGVTTNH